MTDLKTVEMFARALNEFASGQSKTMTQRNRYRTSTLSLAVVLGSVLTIIGVREIRIGMAPSGGVAESPPLDWSQIEAKIEARVGKSTPATADDRSGDRSDKAGEDPTIALLHAQIAVLLRLRIEQDKYAAEIVDNPGRRRLPKPQALVDAEHAADVMLSGR